MAEIVGLEPTMPASKAGALTTWPYPNIVETHAGLEPVIAAVKGLCPNLLDEWAVLQGDELPAYSSGYGMIRHQNIINSHMQQGCCIRRRPTVAGAALTVTMRSQRSA